MNNEVITFGCRLNIYESEVIKKHLAHVFPNDKVLVMNSCAVTAEAERQLSQAIRKAYREDENVKIIVTGCAAQLHPEKYASMPGVWRVIGNQEKLNLDSYINARDVESKNIIVSDIMAVKETAGHLIEGFEHNVRGFLQIQNGCNHRCTFCIIPYARGNSRSVPISQIIEQANILVDRGYKEIVLTGVDITDYGHDLGSKDTLGGVVERLLAEVPGLARLRLSSLDVAEVDGRLIDLFATERRLMPSIHLSLQSGDDMILKRMKRRHLRADIVNFYYQMKRLRHDITFGADVIAGFPTESDEMFQNTYDLLSDLDIIFLHVFPYSERDDTPASRMPQIAKEVRKERARKLKLLCDEKMYSHYRDSVGRTVQVLLEKNNIGRAEDFSQVHIVGLDIKCDEFSGKVAKVQLSQFCDNKLFGTIEQIL